MESNEISMFMDVKLDINEKRAAAAKFKVWTRCEVKIEAIKCLPCFLRITITACCSDGSISQDAEQHQQSLSISVNVPGVTISLATSRTKDYSYGVFWTQNRRDCYVYFALDTEASCRQHMKWLKKSIKNLELYRKVFLEERRNSRAPAAAVKSNAQQGVAVNGGEPKLSLVKLTSGPMSKLPNQLFDVSNTSWSRRISRASDIYEEIFEGTQNSACSGNDPPRLSRRFSRSSIASGIYEEMQPTAANNFNAIVEEMTQEMTTPPPLPPLPPPRKRINTFQTEGMLGEIPRSSTNPESALAKKTKYRNMLENIFAGVNGVGGGARSKRAESFNESQTCTAEELIKQKPTDNVYANEGIAAKRQKKPNKTPTMTLTSKRNSFSSPDLSKINFIDSFNEHKLSDLFQNSSACDDLLLSDDSLADAMPHTKPTDKLLAPIWANKSRADSLESFNVSQQIPNNFNFSACNSSSVNLVGSSGAALLQSTSACMQKNKILIDDMTGYCIMAPIIKKTNAEHTKTSCLIQPQIHKQEPTSSGYSTCSYCSTLSSCTNSTEDHICQVPLSYHRHRNLPLVDDSVIYEQMLASSNTSTTATMTATVPNIADDFTGSLYENLLTVKATQELESHSPLPIPPPTTATVLLTTSTPTESPRTQLILSDNNIVIATEEENYYQTPRKSIISVDEKIPSYYPNSCDTAKQRRRSQSPGSVTTATTPLAAAAPTLTSEKSSTSTALRQIVNIKMRRDRKENLYISSPQKILEQRHNAISSACSSTAMGKCSKLTHKSKKTAHKISENVYAVTHLQKKHTNNSKGTAAIASPATGFSDEMKEKLQTELLQLAMLQKIDFKFDDAGTHVIEASPTTYSANENLQHSENADVEYENCFQATKNASRLLQKYATTLNVTSPQQKQQLQMTNLLTPQRAHYLQINQTSNTPAPTSTANSHTPISVMTQSKLETQISAAANSDVQLSAIKKFASLPRFKKIDFSPLKLKINNVLQRNHHQEF